MASGRPVGDSDTGHFRHCREFCQAEQLGSSHNTMENVLEGNEQRGKEASYHRPEVLIAWPGPCPGQERRRGVDVRGAGVMGLEKGCTLVWGCGWGGRPLQQGIEGRAQGWTSLSKSVENC